MNRATQRPLLPLLAVAVMLMLVVSMVWASQAGWVRNTGNSKVHTLHHAGKSLDKKLLRFTDIDNGAVEVRDLASDSVVRVFDSGEGSFVRGILRSLTRERRVKGLASDEPFELRAESHNRLVLLDQSTGTTLLLNAFGSDNVETFEALLNPMPERENIQ